LRAIPDLRQIVQLALNGMLSVGGAPATSFRSSDPAARGPLGLGYHSEVKLAPKKMAWVGFADAIRLSHDSCEIIDYKTGAESPAHLDQLRIYALLWARDDVVNPNARLATSLAIVYPGSTHLVPPPDERDLDNLEAALESTRAAAERSLE